MPRSGWMLDSLAFTPIAIPHVIVGATVLFAYLMLPIPVYNTIWILLIAYVTMYLPYGMRFMSSGLTQIHKELEEVAEVSGARIRQVFLRILLPLLLPVLSPPGSTYSCLRCANSAPRCSWSGPARTCSAPSA